MVSGPDGVVKRYRRGGRKDLAHRYGIHHIASHIADKRGLMAGAAAGNDTNLALSDGLRSLEHSGIVRGGYNVTVGLGVALQHILHDILGIVGKHLHRYNLLKNII